VPSTVLWIDTPYLVTVFVLGWSMGCVTVFEIAVDFKVLRVLVCRIMNMHRRTDYVSHDIGLDNIGTANRT
jgi:hypothetical protein